MGDKAKHLVKINELLDTVRAELLYESTRLLNSGGIDPDQYDDDEFRLAKIVVSAAIDRNSQMVFPVRKEDQRIYKNLKRM